MHCSKKPVREDYCTYLTPATHLLALRREKAEVEQALVKQKEVRFFHSIPLAVVLFPADAYPIRFPLSRV